jgi:hypothetical protein
MDLSRELGSKLWEGGNAYNFGTIAREEGDLAEARRCCADSIEILCSIRDRNLMFRSVDEAALLAALAGQGDMAARLWGASSASRERTGQAREPHDQRDLDKHLAPARAALCQATGSDDAWARAEAEGRALSDEEAIDAALQWLRAWGNEGRSSGTGPT